MKNKYFIFSLFLAAAGMNTAYAKVEIGDQITDPSSLTNGSKIVMKGERAIDPNAETATYKYLTSLGDSLLYYKGEDMTTNPYVSMVLESAPDEKGQKAFYLKNEKNNKYITYLFVEATEESDGSVFEGEDGSIITNMRAVYTADKSKATPFVIKTVEEGVKLTGYKGDITEEGGSNLMFLTACAEDEDKWVSINYAFNDVQIASYSDYAAWWSVYTANVTENYVDDLSALFETVKNINYISGTDPGYYPSNLVTPYQEAKKEYENLVNTGTTLTNENCKPIYQKLEKAYLDLQVAKPNPVVAGYYRFTSAFPKFKESQTDSKGKVFYGDGNHVAWGEMNEKSAEQVWQIIDRKDGSWLMYNVGTGKYVNGTNGSAFGAPRVSIGNDSTGNYINFSSLGQSQMKITCKNSAAFHAGGHSEGAGVKGDLIVYNAGASSASAWYMNAVTDGIDEFIKIGEQNKVNNELKTLLDKAEAKYNIGTNYIIDKDPAHWLVTSADYEADHMVAFSNADHNEWHPEGHDGDGIPALLDTANATFWHSCWSNPGPDKQHYLQFKLNKAVKEFAILLDRRYNCANQATQLDFYVSNDTTNADGWVKGGTLKGMPGSTGKNSREELYYQTNGITLDGSYQYVRVMLTSNSELVNGQHFTHFAGFHFQPAQLDPNCQNVLLGDVAKKLETEIKNAKNIIENGNATKENIAALQSAYDAYLEKVADPTPLKNKLDSIQGVYDKAATPSMLSKVTENGGGDKVYFEGEVGVYTDGDKAKFKETIDAVRNYVTNAESGKGEGFSKEGIKAQISKLDEAMATFKATQPKVVAADAANKEGVWYYIAASKRYYDVTGKAQDTHADSNGLRNGQLYVNVDEENPFQQNATLNVTGASDINEVTEEDMALWRFISMGDSAYAIQNKGTGLYIGEKTTGNAGLSMTPVAFKISEIGYGTFILDGYRYNGGKTNPLHTQTNGQLGVFWNDYTLGSGSCWDIYTPNHDKGEDVDPESITSDVINVSNIVKGALYTMCYPIDLEYVFDESNENASAYSIAGIDSEKKELILKPITDDIKAGTPFFYVGGGSTLGLPAKPTAADTTVFVAQIQPTHKVFPATPLTVNGLVGNYYNGTRIAKGFGIVKNPDGKPSIGTSARNQSLGWNSAYVNVGMIEKQEVGEGAINVPIINIDNLETAIKDAISDAVTGLVDVYTIDGILVKKDVKASEATKGLVKGIYIVGDKKIAIQ